MGFGGKILPLMDKNSKKIKKKLLAGNVVQVNANVEQMRNKATKESSIKPESFGLFILAVLFLHFP